MGEETLPQAHPLGLASPTSPGLALGLPQSLSRPWPPGLAPHCPILNALVRDPYRQVRQGYAGDHDLQVRQVAAVSPIEHLNTAVKVMVEVRVSAQVVAVSVLVVCL